MLPIFIGAFLVFAALSAHASLTGDSSSAEILAPGKINVQRPATALQDCHSKFKKAQRVRKDEGLAGTFQMWMACQLLEYFSLLQNITDMAVERAAAIKWDADGEICGFQGPQKLHLYNVQRLSGLIFSLSQKTVSDKCDWESFRSDYYDDCLEVIPGKLLEYFNFICPDGGVVDSVPSIPEESQASRDRIVSYVRSMFATDRSPILAAAYAATNAKEDTALHKPPFNATGFYNRTVAKAWINIVNSVVCLVFYVWRNIPPDEGRDFGRHLADSVYTAGKATKYFIWVMTETDARFVYMRTRMKNLPELGSLKKRVKAFSRKEKRLLSEKAWERDGVTEISHAGYSSNSECIGFPCFCSRPKTSA